MNEKEQLIQEIEKAPDILISEVLNFLLFTKSRVSKSEQISDSDIDWEAQLKEMAQDREIKAEIQDINQDFLSTEMDGLI